MSKAPSPMDLDSGQLQSLQAFLLANVAGFEGPLEATRFEGGQSNPTYLLRTPMRNYVMRSKPAPVAQLMPSAHAIEREYRIQHALHGSAVPVPRMLCLCTDESVIGRAFYVMEYIEGRIFWDASLPGMDNAARGAIFDELNRVIAALHVVDYQAIGLGDYGKPGNYFQRQIDRWTGQYRASEGERIDAMERLIEWLPAHIPADAGALTSLVHGDYRLDNVVFHPSEPRILAVIDWELSTLGHPFADFAYHLMCWHLSPDLFRGIAGIDLDALGIPTADQYIAAYERRTGSAVTGDWNYYLAYNMFRLAAILQSVAKRAAEGIASSSQASEYGPKVAPLAALGWQCALCAGAT